VSKYIVSNKKPMGEAKWEAKFPKKQPNSGNGECENYK
jgi:hypothetical protein